MVVGQPPLYRIALKANYVLYMTKVCCKRGNDMELNIDEQTLVAYFRKLDESGKKELLRYALGEHTLPVSSYGLLNIFGECELERTEERPETSAEPIFTE
jgi:hypothetical protein